MTTVGVLVCNQLNEARYSHDRIAGCGIRELVADERLSSVELSISCPRGSSELPDETRSFGLVVPLPQPPRPRQYVPNPGEECSPRARQDMIDKGRFPAIVDSESEKTSYLQVQIDMLISGISSKRGEELASTDRKRMHVSCVQQGQRQPACGAKMRMVLRAHPQRSSGQMNSAFFLPPSCSS